MFENCPDFGVHCAGAQYNCRLYHLDHWTLPDGPSTFLLNDRPLIDNGGRIGTFYENRCKSK